MRLMTAALVAAFSCLPASAGTLPTYTATVVSVTDGDSLRVLVPAWRDTPFANIAIRVAGIDTPESRKPLAKCAAEIALGKAATAYAKTLLHPGDAVVLTYKSWDKYGRIDGAITLPDGRDLATVMLASGMAKTYNGGTKQKWC